MSTYQWDVQMQARVDALETRVETLSAQLEALQPAPITFPTIDPDRLKESEHLGDLTRKHGRYAA